MSLLYPSLIFTFTYLLSIILQLRVIKACLILAIRKSSPGSIPEPWLTDFYTLYSMYKLALHVSGLKQRYTKANHCACVTEEHPYTQVSACTAALPTGPSCVITARLCWPDSSQPPGSQTVSVPGPASFQSPAEVAIPFHNLLFLLSYFFWSPLPDFLRCCCGLISCPTQDTAFPLLCHLYALMQCIRRSIRVKLFFKL